MATNLISYLLDIRKFGLKLAFLIRNGDYYLMDVKFIFRAIRVNNARVSFYGDS